MEARLPFLAHVAVMRHLFRLRFTTLIMAFHFVPNAVESGFSPATAATAFGVLSAMNTIGVLIVGPIADKVGNKTLLGLVYFFRGVGYVLLLTLPGQWGLWASPLWEAHRGSPPCPSRRASRRTSTD